MNWFASTAHPVVQRRWGQECILYDVDSGNTYLVTPLAADVLLQLQRQACDMDRLTHNLSIGDPNAALPAKREALLVILDDLERIGLVRRQHP